MKPFLRWSATLAALISAAATTLRADCASEILSSPELLLCAGAEYRLDDVFDGIRSSQVVKSGMSTDPDNENAHYDGFGIFDTEFPTPDDLVPPFFADVAFNFDGSPATAKATSVTTRHSSDVEFWAGSNPYENKRARARTRSQVKLLADGEASSMQLGLSSAFKLRDNPLGIGPPGTTVYFVAVSITNQNQVELYHFEGAAEVENGEDSEAPPANSINYLGDFDGVVSSSVDPSDSNAFDFTFDIEAVIPFGLGDEITIDVETGGAVLSADFMSGDTSDPDGWASSSPGSTIVTVSTEACNLDIVGLDPYVPGDLTGDGFVGLGDVLTLSNNWGNVGDPGCVIGDASGDGKVDLGDVLAISNAWNPPPAPTSSVPEPTTLPVLGFGLACLARRRPHRR